METLTINREFAARYEKKKRAEELSKLRDKYGDIESDSSSSSSEEEDETAMEDNDRKTRNFFRTLSLLKKGDARIYDKDAKFYDDESSSSGENRPVKTAKPVYLKDFERQQLLEKGEMAGVSDDEEEDRVITHSEEQAQLKTDFQDAVRRAEAEDDNDGDVLTLRHKSATELEQEEAEYLKWLKNQPADLSPTEASDMVTLQQFWSNPKLDKDEAFLRDYILNKGWLDMTPSIPSYQEIVDEQPDASDDEDAIEEQDDFERQFNFRFEEPNKELISRYPRTVSGSVRRTDEQRKLKRKEREERKTEEKKRKQNELKRLKNLKRQEIQDKLDKLRELTGNATVGFDDLDGDFDPDTHDAAMSRVYDHFEDAEEDEEKPVFSDSDEEEVNWDEWMPDEEEPHCEDPDFNMDADFNPSAVPTVKKQRGNKRKSKFAEVVTSNKQRFNPEEKTFDRYMDEYYQFEYEDFIGDLPCRFKYREVVPNDFGLTTEEILTCEDRELNKWASLKKTVQYRTKEEEEKDVKFYRKKGRNQDKKQRVLVSYYEPQKEEEEEAKPKKQKSVDDKPQKRKKAKNVTKLDDLEEKDEDQTQTKKRKRVDDEQPLKRKKAKVNESDTKLDDSEGKDEEQTQTRKRKRTDNVEQKKHKKPRVGSQLDAKLDPARLAAYGLTTKTKKRKKNKQKQ